MMLNVFCISWLTILLEVSMVDVHTFKKRIAENLTQEYTLEFLGDNLEEIICLLSDTKAEKIYQWVQEILALNIRPIVTGSPKAYKEWKTHQLLTFRYPFSINNTEYRILLVKVKNSIYIEFHLCEHKYYDKVRKDLDLKRGNY